MSTDLLTRLQQDVHAARRLYAAITQPAPLGIGRQRAQQLRPKPQGALDPLPAIPSRIPAKHRPFLNALQHILGEPGCSLLLGPHKRPHHAQLKSMVQLLSAHHSSLRSKE